MYTLDGVPKRLPVMKRVRKRARDEVDIASPGVKQKKISIASMEDWED